MEESEAQLWRNVHDRRRSGADVAVALGKSAGPRFKADININRHASMERRVKLATQHSTSIAPRMAAEGSTVRECYAKPQHPLQPLPLPTPSRSTRVVVKHPGYGGCGATLFTLSACDGAGGDRADFDTLLTACAIVTCNRFDGWLSSDLQGKEVVGADAHGLVAAATYFFHVPAGGAGSSLPRPSDDPYPVVPTFRTWPFPHTGLPDHWRQAETADREGARDPRELAMGPHECRLTCHSLKVQRSHIIPSSEKQWFGANSMDQYGNISGRGGQDVIDKSDNIIPFRADVHQIWDDYQFVVVPRRRRDGGLTWAAHAMTNDPEVMELYHRVPLHTLNSPAEYLFARLAYDVFPKILGFLQTGKPRRLWVPAADDPESLEDRMCSGSECRNFAFDQGRGRSSSPMKRPRQDADQDSPANVEAAECPSNVRKRPRRVAKRSQSVDSAISGISHDRFCTRDAQSNDGSPLGVDQEVDPGKKSNSGPTVCRRREESPDVRSWSRQNVHHDEVIDEEMPRGRKRRR